MTVNIFGRHSSIKESIKKISVVFGDASVWWFKPTKAGNSIVVALNSPRKLDKNQLNVQAQVIETSWSLPARKWPKVLTSPSLI
jgi:hypothetical protein